MPDLLLELFSEEIPARMQARAADDLARLVSEALAALAPSAVSTFHGPRRIALAATLAAAVPAASVVERGPRASAPEQALAGFLRKHGAARDDLVQEGEHWVLRKASPAQDAAALVASVLPGLLRRFPWPKSMRWGATGSLFTWIRPLRRILCLLDGAVVPFALADGADDGHGLHSGGETEGHRFMAPGAFPVRSASEWRAGLLAKRVLVDAAERRSRILAGVTALAAEQDLTVVDDPALLDEVAGLVEWPVPLLGRIDAAYMDLPAEVMQVSMRVNQRYFALRTRAGAAAPFFAFAANIEAPDGGVLIIAGNERVLRARFSDARHFWDADRKVRLADRVAALDAVTFHAKLGSQGARVTRVMQLSESIAPGTEVGRAALLCKADLTTGMVKEFPELQGVMGSYYAEHDNEAPVVVRAIRDHYKPLSPMDALPVEDVSWALALADRLDTIVSLFAAGERPSGSSDPYGLRRAGLAVVRLIFIAQRRQKLTELIDIIERQLPLRANQVEVLSFLRERLRFFLKETHSIRHDIVDAVFAVDADDDFQWLSVRARDIQTMIGRGEALLQLISAYKRAANILRIEEKKGFELGEVLEGLFNRPEESQLLSATQIAESRIETYYRLRNSFEILNGLCELSHPIAVFFDRVTVNDPNPAIRRNRLNLLQYVRTTMDRVADFSRIEG